MTEIMNLSIYQTLQDVSGVRYNALYEELKKFNLPDELRGMYNPELNKVLRFLRLSVGLVFDTNTTKGEIEVFMKNRSVGLYEYTGNPEEVLMSIVIHQLKLLTCSQVV